MTNYPDNRKSSFVNRKLLTIFYLSINYLPYFDIRFLSCSLR